jgi:peptide/nickel transport system permease protein
LSLTGYALRRLLAALPLLWIIWTLTFLVGRLLPGDPFDLYASPNISPEALDRLRRAYGLDRSLPLQYLSQLGAMLRGDLALSTSQGRPVSTVLAEAIGPTLLLAIPALLAQLACGFALGVASALRRDSAIDRMLGGVSLVLYSTPTFLLGILLTMVFAYGLDWLPPSHMASVDPGIGGPFVDRLRHLALPLLTLVLGSFALPLRLARDGTLEAAAQEFVLGARSRGLPEWRVIGRHALRHAVLPVLTLMGMLLPLLLSGALVVEVVFSWPGLGQVTFQAIRARDYPVVQATALLSAAMVVVGSLMADLMTALVDPRVRLTTRGR